MQYAFCTSEYSESAVDGCSVQSSALVVPACVFYTVAQRGKGENSNVIARVRKMIRKSSIDKIFAVHELP